MDSNMLSGITEDYSNYQWYKGEKENPYLKDEFHPLAASFWEYEKNFYISFLDGDVNRDPKEAYAEWKKQLLEDYLPGKSPNPTGDKTNWIKSFETGKRIL